MSHETNWSTSAELVRRIIPDHYDFFWQDSDILNGNKHDIIHHLIVFGLVNYIGKQLIAKGKDIDLLALDAAALVHDTQRMSESPEDIYHGIAAQMYLQAESNKLWPFTGFFTEENPRSLGLARKIVFFHNTKLQEAPYHLKNNWTYRVFKFCDALTRVRDSGQNNDFEVTPEFLEERLPGIFTKDQLQNYIKLTQQWHETAQNLRSQHHYNQTEAVLKAGIETGFLV